MELTREKLEELVGDIVEQTMKSVAQCVDDAGPRRRRRSTTSSWSAARRACRWCSRPSPSFFGKPPHRGVNPDEVVALGAAIQGSLLGSERRATCCCST